MSPVFGSGSLRSRFSVLASSFSTPEIPADLLTMMAPVVS